MWPSVWPVSSGEEWRRTRQRRQQGRGLPARRGSGGGWWPWQEAARGRPPARGGERLSGEPTPAGTFLLDSLSSEPGGNRRPSCKPRSVWSADVAGGADGHGSLGTRCLTSMCLRVSRPTLRGGGGRLSFRFGRRAYLVGCQPFRFWRHGLWTGTQAFWRKDPGEGYSVCAWGGSP